MENTKLTVPKDAVVEAEVETKVKTEHKGTEPQETKQEPVTFTFEDAKAASLEYFNGDDLAASVFVDKYALRDNENRLVEKTPEDMHRRLAREFARIEQKYPNPLSYVEILSCFDLFKWIVPQGSPMAAIGNPYQVQSCSNCFALASPVDSYGGILLTDQQQAQIMKRRGGAGHDISNLRPCGTVTKNAARTSDGITIFMRRFSNTCREVAQNGRRGALMLTCSIHHPESVKPLDPSKDPTEVIHIKGNSNKGIPDIDVMREYYDPERPDFATIKYNRNEITGANLSLRLTDEFMNAVKGNKPYEQRWPVDSKKPVVSNMVDAKRVWKKIIHSAWQNAEPGLLFWDTAQRYTPSEVYKDFGFGAVSTNPCLVGETMIAVADGRGFVSFEQLAKEGKDVPVYCLNEKGQVVVRMMRNPRQTGVENVWRITLDDGTTIEGTENHEFKQTNGKWIPIADMNEACSLHLSTKFEGEIVESIKGGKSNNAKLYWMWKTSGRKIAKTDHRLIWEFHNGKVPKGSVIHHNDFDPKNNSIENLSVEDAKEHHRMHSDKMRGSGNPMFRIKADPKKMAIYSAKMSLAVSGDKNGKYIDVSNDTIKEAALQLAYQEGCRFSVGKWVDYAKANGFPQAFSSYRQKELGAVSDLSMWAAKTLGLPTELDPRLIQTVKNMREQGYTPVIKCGKVLVDKVCENCGKVFYVEHLKREQATCNHTCSNLLLNKGATKAKRQISIRNIYAEKAKKVRNSQLSMFTMLKHSLSRLPMRAEWEEACREQGIPFRTGTEFGFKNWEEMKKEACFFNHRVTKKEFVGQRAVYNGTVDEFHNYFVGGKETCDERGRKHIPCFVSKNCGEIILSAYDSCRLMAINLFSFVKNPFTKNAEFDHERLQKCALVAQRLMDDMVDIETEQIDKILAKIDTDPEPEEVKATERSLWKKIRKACIDGRRTGLGPTALGDAIAALGLRYGSPESIKATEEIYKSMCIGSYRSSCIMAKERGAFPVFSHELEKNHPYLQRIWDAAPDVYKLYKKYGRRNIANLTTAPTGSVSILTQTTSGIEPVFSLWHTRRKKINAGDKGARLDFVDQMGDKWQEFKVYHHGYKRWMEISGKTDVKDSPYYKATANEIDWVASVQIQAVAQKWICHSISKTCVTTNTLVETASGLMYIDELLDWDTISDGEHVKAHDLKAKTHLGSLEDVDRLYKHGVKPVFEIRLKNGLAIKATADERVLVLDDETGEENWKFLNELEEGDRVKLS